MADLMRSILTVSLALLLLPAARAHAQQTTAFHECGVLRNSASTTLFAADGGGLFEVENLGPFGPGSRVFVEGEMLWGCAPGVVGCVLGNSIRDCGPALGTEFCPGDINSLGRRVRMSAHGSPVVADNDVILVAEGMHWNTLHVFVLGSTVHRSTFSAEPLCVGAPVQRLVPRSSADVNGYAGRVLDLSSEPALSRITLAAPTSVYFQVWYRDGGLVSLKSNALRIDFVP